MPHKRSKQSIRQADRSTKGKDLPPKTNQVDLRDMPKGAMRILNAAKVQEDYHRRKKEENAKLIKKKEKNFKGHDDQELKIKTGEHLKDFNRRVENAMASDVNATIKSTRGSKRKRKTDEKDANDRFKDDAEEKRSSNKQTEERNSQSDRDWQIAQQKRRINDVVQAPPNLTKAPRGMVAPSMRRKAELEAERERAIRAYRLVKEQKQQKAQQ
ncbi:uncharacterized protein FA14DRAFT_141913 [Meira miltonrushii]|uniref:Uncharacterized protein n=1 Tax=Meira miltonrushii TaxID=1280837 RepID=A0A316VIT0_9BASI|nr:uncharacterized protein FA14DRAFT_141913 [Meira miltonrushii]PWN37539.1 hypothetical protein FA14DRAFT_141913 [Meira miltonrushii]